MVSDPVLSVTNVSFTYPQAAAPALRGVSFRLDPGERVALVGPNGSGKSTLIRLLCGVLTPAAGTVTVTGLATALPENSAAIHQRCGLVFANPGMQLVANTVEEDLAFGPGNLGWEPARLRAAVDAVLARLEIAHLRERLPHTLSGGEEQLVALAGVLVLQPRVLLLDEPTAHLDAGAARRVWDTVERLRAEDGVAIVWITHAMPEADRCARLLALADGELVHDGPPAGLWDGEPAGRRVHCRPPARREIARRVLGVGAAPDEQLVPRLAAAVKARPPRLTARREPLPAADGPAPPPVLAFHQAAFGYRLGKTERTIFRALDVALHPGCTLLVGPSGSGKTTFLQLLFGFLRLTAGEFHYRGVRLDNRPAPTWSEFRRRVGFLFQFPERQLFAPTVREELAFGARWLGWLPARISERIDELLTEYPAFDRALLARDPFTLSLGQQRAVAIASALMTEPEILLFDEPLSGLDPRQGELLTGLLRAFAGAGGTLVVATHQLAELWGMADAILALRDGGVTRHTRNESGRDLVAALRAAQVAPPDWLALLDELRAAGALGDYPVTADAAQTAAWLRADKTKTGKN